MNNLPLRSGNTLIDAIFDLCVQILLGLANLFGVSYNTINVVIFCVVWPILTIVLIVIVVRQRMVIRKYRQTIHEAGHVSQ